MSLSVSIIVNVRNGEKFIAQCIETIKNQSYDAYEVIFVDNNSSDNTRNLISEHGKTSGIYKKIRLISVEKTLSLAAARNLGLDCTTSDLVAFLDVDDMWHPSKLLHQVNAIIEYDADMCATNFILENQRNNSKKIYINKKINGNNLRSDILKDFYIHFSSFVVKKSVILESKVRFEEEYEIIEDLDFVYTLSKNQYKFIFLDEPLTTYLWHNNNYGSNRSKMLSEEYGDFIAKNIFYRVGSVEKNWVYLYMKMKYYYIFNYIFVEKKNFPSIFLLNSIGPINIFKIIIRYILLKYENSR